MVLVHTEEELYASQEPATRGEATDRYADFRNERSRLVFGAEGAETTGRVGRIVILTFKKPI